MPTGQPCRKAERGRRDGARHADIAIHDLYTGVQI